MAQIKTALPVCPDTGKPIIEISHSGLNTFSSCPRKFAWRKAIVSFNREMDSKIAADVGTAMHEGIQNYLQFHDEDRALEAMAIAHPIDIQDSAAAQYSLEAAAITLRHVIREDDLDNFELATFVKDGKTIPAIEIAFLLVIETEHLVFHLRGFIDAVMLNRSSGNFVSTDIKTMTPQAESKLEVRYHYDYQTTSYGIPLQGLLGLEGSFDTAIYGIVMSDRDPSSTLVPYRRTPADIEEYYFYLLDKCAQIERYWVAQRFPRDPKGCLTYGRVCPHFTDCTTSSLWDMQLRANPSLKPGDPGRPFVPVFTAKLDY